MPIASPSWRRTRAHERVERAGLDVAAALADEADDPLAQLGGGAVRERDREDPPRRDALDADEVGDPMGQDARLARAGAGEDQERALGRRDGARLLRVEGPDDLLGALRAARGDGRRIGGRDGRGRVARRGPGASRSQAGSSGAPRRPRRASAKAVPTASAAAAAASSSVGSPVRRRRVGLTRHCRWRGLRGSGDRPGAAVGGPVATAVALSAGQDALTWSAGGAVIVTGSSHFERTMSTFRLPWLGERDLGREPGEVVRVLLDADLDLERPSVVTGRLLACAPAILVSSSAVRSTFTV